jgi:hypothetical protein
MAWALGAGTTSCPSLASAIAGCGCVSCMVRAYVRAYMCVCVYTCVRVHVCVCTDVCTYMCVCVCQGGAMRERVRVTNCQNKQRNSERYSIENNYNYVLIQWRSIGTHMHVRECGLRAIRHVRMMLHMSVSYCSCSQRSLFLRVHSPKCVCVCSVVCVVLCVCV